MQAVETLLDVTTTLPAFGEAPAVLSVHPSGAFVPGGAGRSPGPAPSRIEKVSAL